MLWQLYHGDILDVPAEALVCSANVYLTLSGGVGEAFLLRYGPAMQEALFRYLGERSKKYVEQGTVIAMEPCGSPYRVVLHAVAVDGLYDTTSENLAAVMRASLEQAAQLSARTVALTALATGYGRKPIELFGHALESVIHEDFPVIQRVVIGLRQRSDVDQLRVAVPGLGEL